MGSIYPQGIIVRGFDDQILEVHQEALKYFAFGEALEQNLTSNMITEAANFESCFFIAPDGSKYGWETQIKFSKKRKAFTDYIDELNVKKNYNVYYAVINFDGDDCKTTIETTSD